MARWLLLAMLVPAVTRAAPLDGFLRLHAETRGFMLGRPVAPWPTPDGKSVLFLRSPPRTPELSLYELTAATGETRELVTPRKLLQGADEQLTPDERARRERMRVSTRGFGSFALSDDGALVLLPLSGRLYTYRRSDGAIAELPTGEGAPIDPKLSPDGKKVAYVRNGDLYVLELGAKKPRRLTTSGDPRVTNGLAEFVA
ncbi:MAG TPA: DPP IV N-terminal domain-containing protein, partial [Polyangia bacterium]|nr:DPP IV N-terminal domain-containing protein [Polyangia bacterium]